MIEGAYGYQDPPTPPACADDPPPPRPYFILRFFASGIVCAASVMTSDPARDWDKIGGWLTEAHTDRGSYQLDGNNISFSIVSAAGRVDYFGVLAAGSMTLSWRSAINGGIGNGRLYTRFEARRSGQ